ncbi:MAG: N-acetylmuramoyl-L-alanine amidase [Myxococcales bacterium]|nr:N-acetylmuramoyl-L-alanine amidase [Myxococcales bacterium]
MAAPDIVLCVGHSRRLDNGASSVTGMSEWDFNSRLAPIIARKLGYGWSASIIEAYDASNYTDAMAWLAEELSRIEAPAAIELHFNAGGGTGHQWLHGSSEEAAALARALSTAFNASFATDELPPRLESVQERLTGNGALFLNSMPCPTVIAEPFFGDNTNDWTIAQDMERLADAYAAGIGSWLGNALMPPRRSPGGGLRPHAE